MAVVKIVELQDADGNIVHPHTEAKGVFLPDGSTLEQHMNEDILEDDVRTLFNNSL